MIIYLTLTALVLGIALLVQKDKNNSGSLMITRQNAVNTFAILIIFSALFWVSALRINVGNDYAKYVEFMHLVYSKAYVPTEIGFNAITYAIYYICGFENYILVFAFFAFFTILFFMVGMWQQSKWFTFSFVMFMLLGYYFQSLSTVRYYLALGMALYSIKFVIKRDWPRFVFLVLIGAMFHKSILVLLLLYPLASIRWKRWMYGILGLGCISCLFLQDLYLKIVIFLYPSYKNTEYLEGGTSPANIVRCALVLALSIWVYKDQIKDDRTNIFYFHCNLLSLALYVFGSFLPIISRIGYYLTVTQLLFIPAVLVGIRDDRKKRILTSAVLAACLIYFALYMRGAANDGVRILPYLTVMFDDMPLTLSEVGYQ